MTSQVEQAVSELEDIASLLKKTHINLKKCPKERLSKPGYLQTRIQTIEDYWTAFKKAHQNLLRCTTREQRGVLPYYVNDEYLLHEDLYLCIIGDLKDMLVSSTSKMTDQSLSSNTSTEEQLRTKVKLPRITIPSFSGYNYEDWPTFKDLYVSLIHNCTTLSDVEKLHYLKSSITGEAASLLKNIQVTGTNYAQAWETLNQRYNNRRLIVNALLKRLFAQKKCNESAAHLKLLLDTTSEIVSSLNNLNVPTESWDPVIIFLVVQKLDPETHKEWEKAAYLVKSEELPSWKDLREFLEAKFRMLELVTPTSSTRYTKERVLHVTATANEKQKSCILCNEVHTLSHCNTFNKMTIIERGEYVKANKLCFNCLGAGHAVFKCRMPMSCHICKRRHHTLLHQQKKRDESIPHEEFNQSTSSSQADVEEKEIHAMVASHFNAGQKIALLATAVVILKSEYGHTTVLRALIDSGSQARFISEKATQILNLNKSPVNLIVSGMESMKVRVKHEVKVQVASRWESNFNLPIRAYVMSKQLTSNIPSGTMDNTKWPHLAGIQLADRNYCESGTIDLLLGVNEYAAILKQGLIKGPPGTPCAQNTYLGWIIMGEITMKINTREKSLMVMKQEVNIEDLQRTIWEVETNTKGRLTVKEQLCEDIYEKRHKRNKDGKYIVNTNQPESVLGNTRYIAKRTFIQLERRFSKNFELKQKYRKVINEYKKLKHIEIIPKEEISKKSVYLPHHAVIRNAKETTKTRVIFDASSKGCNELSREPSICKPFVANRVDKITSNVNYCQWHHVQSHDNPAETASKGILVANLKRCDLWWNGPHWLLQPKIQLTIPTIQQIDKERNKYTVQALIINKDANEEERKLCTQFKDFDTLVELLKTIAYCRRFLKQKTLKENIDQIIKTEDLQLSLDICIN